MPVFEFALHAGETGLGLGQNRNCVGGGGSATLNLNSAVGLEADVSGCKTLGLSANQSGDMTTFMAGPRFSHRSFSQWTPWVHVLFGGEKVTTEVLSPDLKAVVDVPQNPSSAHTAHNLYTRSSSTTGLAMAFGGGVDWELTGRSHSGSEIWTTSGAG